MFFQQRRTELVPTWRLCIIRVPPQKRDESTWSVTNNESAMGQSQKRPSLIPFPRAGRS